MTILDHELYSKAVKRISASNNCYIYKMNNETGEGRITRYSILPGVNFFYNDIHMENGQNENKLPQTETIEINHCREGRFECEFENGDCLYLGMGDLSIMNLSLKTRRTSFPLSHYHGISITIHLPSVSNWFMDVNALLGGSSVYYQHLQEILSEQSGCLVLRADEAISRIFYDLYTLPQHLMEQYLKVKFLELSLYLETINPVDSAKEKRYFYRNQIITVKRIRDFITANLSEHYTLKQLSEQFDIPLTSMKTCFREVYGTGIYSYMRSYRINKATLLLQQTNSSIIHIATKVGYGNPSKFSEAFRKETGMLPSDFRKKLVQTEAVMTK